MNQMVRRTARRQKRDHGVHDDALVYKFADGRKSFTLAQAENGADCLANQRFAQRLIGMNKRAARNMQPHGLQQHLIAVRRAVERTRSSAVIRGGFRLLQLAAAYQSLRVLLADLGFIAVR